MVIELELVPGVIFEPFFKSEEAYQMFRDRWTKNITPSLDEQRRKRALSAEDARHHYID